MADLPRTMNAMVLTVHGDVDKLVWHEDRPRPDPGPGQVLIRVTACGLNNTDVNTCSGWYSKTVSEATTGGAHETVASEDPTWGGAPITFPRIQGADACGHVVAVGPGVDAGLIGKRAITYNSLRDCDDPLNMAKARYFGSEADGGCAQYAVIDQRNVGVVGGDLTDAELATLSCRYTTAEGMLCRANVAAGDRVLVTGASGGVGSAAIQLAKRRGATVVGLTAEDKHAALAPFGADALLPRAPADLKAALKDAIGSPAVDVVVDIVGGPYFPTVIDALDRGGRYTCSGAIAGPIVDFDLRTFYLRDLTFTGSTIIPPNVFTDLLGYIERGEIRPALAATYPLKDQHAAQRAVIAKRHAGNIVVTP